MEDKLREKTDYKFKIVKEFYKTKKSIREFSKENDLKKSNLSRWLKQFDEKGYEGLMEKSKRRKHYEETPKQIQKIIVELSKKLNLGSKSIANTLSPIYGISHTGTLIVLRRNGITVEKEKKRWKAFRSPYKNHTWQIDFLGPHSTHVGEISILVVLDDYSRYTRSLIVEKNGTASHAISFLKKCMAELGKPERILTDNGTQFRKTFDKFCKSIQVKHVKSRVRHPQTLGKVEAVNKMLGGCFKLDFLTIMQGQRKLDAFMEWRNQMHFHSIIQSTPANAYGVQRNKFDVLKEISLILELTSLGSYFSNCPISGFT